MLVSGAIWLATLLSMPELICEQNIFAYSYALAGSIYGRLSKKLSMYSSMNSELFLVSAASAVFSKARRMLSLALDTSASEKPYLFIFSTSVRKALNAGMPSPSLHDIEPNVVWHVSQRLSKPRPADMKGASGLDAMSLNLSAIMMYI